MRHLECHRTERIGGLHAAILGADDGLIRTASPIIDMADAVNPNPQSLLS